MADLFPSNEAKRNEDFEGKTGVTLKVTSSPHHCMKDLWLSPLRQAIYLYICIAINLNQQSFYDI